MIQPCYYKGERGNKPYPLEIMLRLYLLQNLYDLSDEATVAEAIDSRAFSEFCSVDSSNQVPDGDTLGRFRNLLIRNGLQEKLFAQVVAALMERGLILKKGTIVDSTIISAPSSTRNKEKKRDSDAHQVKKGNTWHFGYKAHIGVDKDSGLVHTVKATAANVHDVSETSKLLTGEEEAVYGDSGYLGAGKREDAVVRNKSGHKIKYKINRRPSQVKKLSRSYLNLEGVELNTKKYETDDLHWVHKAISNLKAFLQGTYHGRCTKLQAYLDEYCFRFNRRMTGNQIFLRLTRAVTTSCSVLS